jgi:hypothetical protein
MHSSTRLISRALIPAIVAGTVIAQGLGAGPAAASTVAGTNIGNATQLTATASGSLASHLSDDWWVVYPATAGGAVQVRVTNTGGGSSGCTSVVAFFRDTNGSQVVGVPLTPNSSYNTPFSASSSNRYFVELRLQSCDPTKAVHYALKLQSGGGGTAPQPVSSAATAKGSISAAWPPLQGDTAYRGTIASDVAEEWYVLVKHASTSPATVRVENTTVDGSTPCPTVVAFLRDTDGNQLQGAPLSDDTAITFTVTNGGRYYLELTDQGCAAGGPTYRIEPEPTAQWDNPAKLPSLALPVGHTLASAGGPLAGGIVYSATIASANVQDWSFFKPKGTVPVTVSVQNTTLNTATCTTVVAFLTDAHGNQIAAAPLSDNTGHEFVESTASRYYLHVNDQSCNPTTSVLPKFTVTITPANGV